MANLHKSPRHKQAHDIYLFCRSYFSLSCIATIIFVVLAYKDIVYLRYFSGFYAGGTTSAGTQQLLVDGFNESLLQRITNNAPAIALGVLLVMVAYSVVNSYQRTYENLLSSKHYVNAKKASTVEIVLLHIAIRAASFTLPLLYWCFYLAVWFPALVKLPLKYIASGNVAPIMFSAFGVVIVLSLLTHTGVILSRLAVRMFKHM